MTNEETNYPWALKFILKKEARSKGGDRYECQPNAEERPIVLYFPQYISRPKGAAEPVLEVIVSVPNP